MPLSLWFYRQLQTSTEGFLWAIEQIPGERHSLLPKPNRWSVARIIYHMKCYDQFIGLPALRQWGGEPFSLGGGFTGEMKEDAAIEEAHWNNGEGHDVATMIADFKKLRAEQLTLIQQFREPTWDEERDALWGSVTLKWVMTKTYQHTLEHTDEILRLSLWWK